MGSAVLSAITAQAANLLQFPEELEKWKPVQGITVTANAAAAPNGSQTAEQLNDTSNGSGPRIQAPGVTANGGQYVFSCYARAGSLSGATLMIRTGSGSIVGKQEASLSSAWQRISVTLKTAVAAGQSLHAEIYPGVQSGENGTVFAWGAQLEPGTTPTPYGGTTPTPDTTPPAAPSGLTAQATSGSVQLNWTANSEADLARYQVWRAATAGGTFSRIAETTARSYTDSAVTAGSTYSYRLTAVDQTGNVSQPSASVSVTTPATQPPPTAPAAPSGLSGSWNGTAVQLTWSAVTNAASYRVERATGTGSGSGSGSNLLQFPEEIEKWRPVHGITVNANAAAAPNGTQTAEQLNDTTGGSGPRVQAPGVTANGGQYVFSCYVRAGSLSRATLMIRTGSGSIVGKQETAISSAWQRVAVTLRTTVAAGQSLVAEVYPGVQSGESGTIFAWGAQLEPGTTPSAYGSGGGGEPTFTQVGTTTSPSFADSNVSAGATYQYRVRAVNSAGVSDPSNTVSVTVTSSSPTAPAAPTGLAATWNGTAVQVTWSASPETNVTGYRVERGVNSTTSFTQVAAPSQPGYTDTAVSAGNTYSYRVRAVNTAGASAPSAVVSATVPSASTNITRGPYLQMASHNAMTIRWRTAAATNSRVRYGTTQGSLTSFTDQTTVTTEHEVRVTNLAPNTKYFYSVGSTTQVQGGNDASHFFVTHPTPGTVKPTRVWVIGDAGTADSNQRAVRDAYYRFTGTRQTDLWLMLGDNAYDDGTDSEYQQAVFNIYGDLLRQSTVWSTRGNHERSASTYYGMFTLPANAQAGGLASGTEAYYSFDYANIHFICLDSEGSDRSATGAMAQWVRADLANTTQTWVVVYFHHPPYSKGSHDSDTESQLVQMRTNILPILEEGGVDLVLSGHSHSYERSYLLDGHYGKSDTLTSAMKLNGGSGRADTSAGAYSKATPGPAAHQGTVYAVAGASGKTSSGSLDHPAMYISLRRLGSMVLDVNGNRMDVKYLRETGAVDDYFTIVKGGG